MRFLTSAVVLLVLCGSVYSADKYTTKYDNVDIQAIVKNDRLLKGYVDCVLGKRACTRDGEELKRNLPDALQNGCQKCSETQKNGSRIIIRHLIKNKRNWWNELEAKFDPHHSYRQRYAEELKKEGIVF